MQKEMIIVITAIVLQLGVGIVLMRRSIRGLRELMHMRRTGIETTGKIIDIRTIENEDKETQKMAVISYTPAGGSAVTIEDSLHARPEVGITVPVHYRVEKPGEGKAFLAARIAMQRYGIILYIGLTVVGNVVLFYYYRDAISNLWKG